MASTVSSSVVGIRCITSGRAGSRWKNDWPKSPRAMLRTKRANCTGSGSLKPMACRSTARSDSGASGIMSDTGSPLTCRIEKVTTDTPTSTTTRRMSRRVSRLSTPGASRDQRARVLPRQRAAGLAS